MKLNKFILSLSALVLGLNILVTTVNAAPTGVLDVSKTKTYVKLISNVVYEQVPSRGYDNVAMKMDILKPETRAQVPAIVYVTGGGFINANKDSYIQQRMDLAEAGYLVASIEYRVAPAVTFPKPLEDVKAAVRFLRANSKKYNINPAKIGLIGGSAGGYLVTMGGVTSGIKEFDKGDNLNVSSDVQAVVDTYGVTDLGKIGADYSMAVQELHKSPGATEALWVNGSPVFGGKDGGVLADPKKLDAANPWKYISSKTPPFLIMHGDIDTVVSPSQSALLHDALIAKGIPSTYYVVKNAKHGGDYWVQPEISKLIIDFFDKNLK